MTTHRKPSPRANDLSAANRGTTPTTVPHDPEPKMSALALTFPSTANAPHVRPWDATGFDRWASDTALSHGEVVTAQFLLAVWSPDEGWRCGRFDLMEALGVWDERHRAAFLVWAGSPWWP